MSYLAIFNLKSSNEIKTFKTFKKFNNDFEINEIIKLKVEKLLKECEFDKIKEIIINGDKFLLSREQYLFLLSNCYDEDFYLKLYQHGLWFDINLIEESIKMDNIRIFKLLIKTFGHGWGHSHFNCIVLRFAFNQFNPDFKELENRKKNEITSYITKKVKKSDLLLVIGSIIKENISTMTKENHCLHLIKSSVYLHKLIHKLYELEIQLTADNKLLKEKVTQYNKLVQTVKSVKNVIGVNSEDNTVERFLYENVKNGSVKNFNLANNFMKQVQKERGVPVKGLSLGCPTNETQLNSNSEINKQNQAKSIDRLEAIILEKEIERSLLNETIKYETCKMDGISSEYQCSKYLNCVIPENFNGISFENALIDLMHDEDIEEIDYLYPHLHLLSRIDPIHRDVFIKYRFFDLTDFGILKEDTGYRIDIKHIKNKQLLAGYSKNCSFGDVDKFISSNPSILTVSPCLPSHFNYFKDERIITELLEFVESTNNSKKNNNNNKKNNTTSITTTSNNQQQHNRFKGLEKQKEKEKEIEKLISIEKKKKIELEKRKKIEKKKKLELEMKKKVDLFNDKKLKSNSKLLSPPLSSSSSSSLSPSPIQQSHEFEQVEKESLKNQPQQLLNEPKPQELEVISQQQQQQQKLDLLYFEIGNETFKISKEDDDIDPNIQFEIDEKVESLVYDEAAEENNKFNLVY